MKKVKYWIRNYFGFSKTETNGFFILFSLMILMVAIPPVLKRIFQTKYSKADYERDLKILDSLVVEIEKNQEEEIIKTEQPVERIKSVKSLFRFDPNKASIEELKSLGLKAFIARRIIKYREKGGRFYVKDDLKRIYGLSQVKFEELKPYINLPLKINKETRTLPIYKEPQINDQSVSRKVELFDINKADTNQLQAVRGIGSVLSERIIKFRDGLGGFVSVDQLSQVYGLKEEVYERLKQKCYVTEDFIPNTININSVEAYELSRHPYISKKLAELLILYREEHGNFKSIDELKQIPLVNDKIFMKIVPYLEL